MNCFANIRKISFLVQKRAENLVKKLGFSGFNKLYVPFSLSFA